MKLVAKRVARLESRLLDCGSRHPEKQLRVVVCRMDRHSPLENSTCTRTLTAGGYLTEVVRLDGMRDDLSDAELERFIEGFPIRKV